MIKRIIGTVFLWSTLGGLFVLHAQENKLNTLGKLWPKVEIYYPGIKAKDNTIEAAALQKKFVQSNNRLPQINAQVQNSYGTYEGSSGAFFTQPGIFNVSGSTQAITGSSTVANTYGSATVGWEVFSFGKQRKQEHIVNNQYEQTLRDKDVYLLQLKKVLSDRYIDFLYQEANFRWKEQNVKRLETIKKITSGLAVAGLRPAADSLLASSSLEQASGEYYNMDGRKHAALFKLLELFGGNSLDYTASSIRFASLPHLRLESANGVIEEHPTIVALNNQEKYFKLNSEFHKKSALPSVKLLGGYGVRGTGISPESIASGSWQNGFSNTSTNFLAGVGVTWNISNLYTNRLQGHQALKKAASVEQQKQQYKLAMSTDLMASNVKLSKQFIQFQKSKEAVKHAQDAFDMYFVRYKNGIISLSELLQIQAFLEQAEQAHIEVSKGYWMLLAYEAELTNNFDFLFNNL